MNKVMYEVRTIQNGLPVWNPDREYMDEVRPKKIVTKVCSCESLEWAKAIRTYVENRIYEGAGYEVNTWTPRVVIVKLGYSEEVYEEDDMEEIDLLKRDSDEELCDQLEREIEADERRIRHEISALESGMVLQIQLVPKGMRGAD